jgi:Fe-S oxidoreductase
MPPCAVACPFGLNVRDFVKKIRRGSFDAALKLYRDAVVFPGIVSSICERQCSFACAKAIRDSAIDISLLEKACLKLSRRTDPINYNLPAKDRRIAVIGGGVSGLACALRASEKGYRVAIYEKNGHIGGYLWNIISENIFLPDIKKQLQHQAIDIITNHEVKDLNVLGGEQPFDAAYIATGKEGKTFGLSAELRSDSARGILSGGMLFDASLIEAIVHGAKAASQIERWLKTGIFEQGWYKRSYDLDIVGDSFNLEKGVETTAYSREEAIAEAERCGLCNCDLCYKSCKMMQYYSKYPERIAADMTDTINPIKQIVQQLAATRLISSCSDCGLCAQECPENINIGSMLMRARKDMKDQGNLPPAFHDFLMRDFFFSCGDLTSIKRPPSGQDVCKLLFFPGCQLGAVNPDYVRNSYSYLREYEASTGLLLQCCGAPAYWAGEEHAFSSNLNEIRKTWKAFGEPMFVTACPTCVRMLEENLPEIHKITLYEILDKMHIFPSETNCASEHETVAVFDPCSSRYFPGMRQSVRSILTSKQVQYNELPYCGEHALCCSWGGHMLFANPALAEQIKKHGSEQSELPYVTYCIICKENFLSVGKQCRHILDIVFECGKEYNTPTNLSKKNVNRMTLRNNLLSEYWNEELIMTANPILHMSDDLRKKISDKYILETDILKVIEYAERTGKKISHPSSGHYSAHMRIGHITYWVKYSTAEGWYKLENAYSHRMSLDIDEKEASQNGGK